MYRAEFGGVHENKWSGNNLFFETKEEAEQYAIGLLARWTGADIARVVEDSTTPRHEEVDPNDERIVASYR